MTDKTQAALKLALIQEAKIQMKDHPSKDARWFAKSVYEYLMAEQPEQQQEPVAEYIGECNDGSLVQLYDDVKKGAKFYTSPPASKPWVGLTQKDWMEFKCKTHDEVRVGLDVAAKLREKNHG